MLKLNTCHLPNEFNTRGTKLIEISIWKYRLIATLRKLDVLETNISPRSEAPRANMIVLRPTLQSERPKAELLNQHFRDINTPLSILFTIKFSSARQLENRYELISTFLAGRRESQMYKQLRLRYR